jgi:hypothetical protein
MSLSFALYSLFWSVCGLLFILGLLFLVGLLAFSGTKMDLEE